PPLGSPSGSSGGPGEPAAGRITTADGASGSRQGSSSASVHHGDRAVVPLVVIVLPAPVARPPGAPCQAGPSGCRRADPPVTIDPSLPRPGPPSHGFLDGSPPPAPSGSRRPRLTLSPVHPATGGAPSPPQPTRTPSSTGTRRK